MKDTLSNIVAVLLIVLEAINAYLQANTGNGEINYFQLALAVLGAVIAYLTGKKQDLKSKAE